MEAYAELQTISNFSFLRGGSHPEELIATAKELGYRAIAITDYNSLAGVVRGHIAARDISTQFIVGCRLLIQYEGALPEEHGGLPSVSILLYPRNRRAYGKLCTLLTIGKRRAPKGGCLLTLEDLLEHQEGLVPVLVPPLVSSNAAEVNFYTVAKRISQELSNDSLLSIALTRTYQNGGARHVQSTVQIAEALNIPLVATNDVYYHEASRRPLQDVLTCIRRGTTLERAGFLLSQNFERYLKRPEEIKRLFREHPGAVERTVEIASEATFSLNELRYEYPTEICPEGVNVLEYLSNLTWKGALERYNGAIPEKVRALIEEELVLIHELGYEKYFLTCYDIVKFARSKEILCQGRGAAANSAVCYALGITAVDPDKIDLLFARFVSKERNEPPDIDIDFEHERREEVIQYIYQKFGRTRAGLTAEVVTYRHRSAVRDVGKALGLPLETVDTLAKLIHRWTRCVIPEEDLREAGLNPNDLTIRTTIHLASEILGFPRHLSQHVGGFIISEHPLSETVPILNASMEDRTIIEWDKTDIEELGMLKIDVLGLGMLSCIRKALSYINEKISKQGQHRIELHTIPPEDPLVYDMLCAADTVGVFQIESRAQMSMLPRLRPRYFYDLVIEVAIVRPGPIQGNMVHPYLKRRNGIEKISFPDERVRDILGKTLGVPLFQEQAMRLAIVLAQFTPGEAEKLRRAMAAWKRNKEIIATFQERVVRGMVTNGYSEEFAINCMNQIKGFSEYGFPESHAASFALLVYASAWIKCHHPAEFASALINSQPMGFYEPSQIISDARQHGVEVRAIDVNNSHWDCTLETSDGAAPAIRLGMRLVKGLSEAQGNTLCEVMRSHGPFNLIRDLYCRAQSLGFNLRRHTLYLLARADAFISMNRNAREALWDIKALPPEVLPADPNLPIIEAAPNLPTLSLQQSMFDDYAYTGLSLKTHPFSFIRSDLEARNVVTAKFLKQDAKNLSLISIGGIVIVRQRPGTARGVVFLTIEDETGIANLIIRPSVFEQFRRIIILSSCVLANGRLERTGEVVYVNVLNIESLDTEVLENREVSFPSLSYSY